MIFSNRSNAIRGQRGRWSMALLALGVLSCALLLLGQAEADSFLPSLEVEDVSVAPSVTSPGEPVQVEANVHNPSAQEAQFEVVLRVDDLSEEVRAVRLPAGATQTLRFTVVRSEPGAHVARVGSQAATFQVLSPQFVVRDLYVDPPVAAVGESILVRATVENAGSARGMYEVPLAIDGVVVDIRNGLLDVGQTGTVAFETVPKAPGSYTVLVGDAPGSITVVSPAFDLRIASSIRISLPTSSAADKDGNRLAITQDVVGLLTTANTIVVTLPAALPPGKTLGYFRDSTSGIAYEGGVVTIPLRNPAYKEMARLVVITSLIAGDGTGVKLTSGKLMLVVPDTLLQIPTSAAVVEPVTFGMEIPLAGLKLDVPVRLTPGLRPGAKARAAVELEARKKAQTLVQVVAAATVEAPFQGLGGQDGLATVSFGVPSAWLPSVGSGTLEVALVKATGGVELSPISETVPAGTQTVLKAKVSQGEGTFALVWLSQGPPPKTRNVVMAAPVAVVGVPMEVRAVAEAAPGGPLLSNAVLLVNNEPVAVERVQVLKDGSSASIFYLILRTPGAYSLTVEGSEAKLKAGVGDVLGHIQVSQMSVSPQKASPGQPVELKATVSNVGPRLVASQAQLLVNGVPTEQRWLALSPGETTGVSFQLVGRREGTYQVALLNARGEFVVAREATPASIQATDLRVEPSTVEPGKPVIVTIVVKNRGELKGTYLARLFVEKREVARREITIDGLTTLPATFPFQPQGEGVFSVEAGGLSQYFAVISSALRSDLVLESLEVDPPTVAGGEQVVATITIRNRAFTSASGVIAVFVNGELVTQREVTLGSRGRTQERVVFSRDTPGMYQVEVRQGVSADAISDVLKAQFLVTRRQSAASWEISRLEVLPQPAAPQEPLIVSFLLSNLGQQEGEFTVLAQVDGVQEAQQTVRVGPQTTLQVSLPLRGRPSGSYVLDVSGTQTRFTVGAGVQGTPVAGTTPGQTATERRVSPWIPLGVSGALAVIGGLTYWLYRSRRKDDTAG
ncbi:MAG: hypothetical protein Q7K03_05855 [Dehalococcoidia bacterium]|nr:hypothetical protein [Dehalococcoidia bacterium]